MKRLFIWLVVLLSVSSISAQGGLYDIPQPFAEDVYLSSTIASTRAGRLLVSNPLTDTVTLLDLDRSIQAEFDIGANPNGVAIVPDNLRAVAVSDTSLAVIDLDSSTIIGTYDLAGQPFGVVADEELAYISLQASNEVVIVDLANGRVQERITMPPAPSGLAKWGDFLYVTHFWSGELSLIYLPTAELARTIQVHPQGTLFAAIEINPIDGLAYLPQSIANTAENATEANRMIPMLYEVNLRTMAVTRRINLAAADRNLSIPYAVRQSTNRSRVYITHAGSNSVTVLNLDTETADNHFETGANPRGLIFSNDFVRIFTQDALDTTVSVFDTRFFALEDQIPSSAMLVDPQTQIASRLFYDAIDERLSSNGLITCASCHWEGQSDGRVWLAAETPILDDAIVEADWLNTHIAMLQGGSGIDVDSIDMDALIIFLQSGD